MIPHKTFYPSIGTFKIFYFMADGTHKFWSLNFSDAVEDDVQTARQDSRRSRLTSHGVRLPRVGDSVGKEKTILPLQELLRQGKPHHVVDCRLGDIAIYDPLEGVLRLR